MAYINIHNYEFVQQFIYATNRGLLLNQVPTVTVGQSPIFTESTPIATMSKPSDELTVLVQPPPVVPDRRSIQQFSGFMYGDAEKFLSE